MQIPFSGWLIRGEDFTSPAIAVISCVTSANAGVFLILKLAPVLGTENFAGIMTMMVGGITFLAASLVAVFRPEAAKTVSCSTVASMGLIVACGGIGSAEAVAAGILLLLLHGVSKALMLASAGTAALDHEKYDGRQDLSIRELFTGRPKLAACMLTGTAALFMANFELLIMRYNSLSEFAESGNILLFAALCFGAGAAIFYLAKCMGQLTLTAAEPELDAGETSLTRPVKLLAALTVFLCIVVPADIYVWRYAVSGDCFWRCVCSGKSGGQSHGTDCYRFSRDPLRGVLWRQEKVCFTGTDRRCAV